MTSRPVRFVPVALVVLATLATSIYARGCDVQTCPPGPVLATFGTGNCGGTPTFYPYTGQAYNTCMNSGPEFVSYNVSDGGVTEYHGESDTCSTAPGITYREQFYPFYVCRPQPMFKRGATMASNSVIVLPNVNATYTSQDTNILTSYPNVNDLVKNEQCPQPNACAIQGSIVDFWVTESQVGSCEPSTSYAQYNVSYDGTCYREGEISYISYQCVDQTTYLIKRYIGQGCQHVTETDTRQVVCTPVTPSTYNCSATPLPPVAEPVAAPGAAPTMGSPSSSPTTGSPATTTPDSVPDASPFINAEGPSQPSAPSSAKMAIPSFVLVVIATAAAIF